MNNSSSIAIAIDDDTPLDTEEMLEDRDRWELDPASAVDR